jgi:hypothetical protein
MAGEKSEIVEINTDISEQFVSLTRRLARGKPNAEDVQALRQMLDAHPELWRQAGDLAGRTAMRMIEALASDVVTRASVARGLVEFLKGLGWAQASTLERALIDEVALGWLTKELYEHQLALAVYGGAAERRVKFWEERATAAQRRFLRASEALARARKMAEPRPAGPLQAAVQVNIGGQQVNVAQVAREDQQLALGGATGCNREKTG